MDMAPEQCQMSICDVTKIKQEPLDTDPPASPKQEIEGVFVKEESMFLHELDVPDALNAAQDPLNIKDEECSSSDDDPGPSMFSIEKTVDEEDKEVAVSMDDGEDVKCEVESVSNGSEPERSQSAKRDPRPRPSLEAMKDAAGVVEAGLSVRRAAMVCGVSRATLQRYLNKPTMLHTNSAGKKEPSCGNERITGRTYSCAVCNKTFSTSRKLKQHSYVHTDERPYSCDICDKSFKRIQYLKMHSLRHIGERPRRCGICTKTFTYNSDLTKHLLLHT